MSPRFVHAGQHGTAPEFGMSLCGKLTGQRTPLADQPEQVNCPTCRRRLQAGWLRWENVPRGAESDVRILLAGHCATDPLT